MNMRRCATSPRRWPAPSLPSSTGSPGACRRTRTSLPLIAWHCGIAAATGAGLFLPMGFEYATDRRFDRRPRQPDDMQAARREAPIDLSDDIAAAIRLIADAAAPSSCCAR